MANIKKAQSGRTLKPNYSNIKGKGWDAFKTPTSKDSAEYREGFKIKTENKDLEQYPFPSGAKIRGYNEASKRAKPKAKSGAKVKPCMNCGGKMYKKK
jgi:hypothetical protein